MADNQDAHKGRATRSKHEAGALDGNCDPQEPRKPRELSAAQIQEILPHRWPFLLVDRITDYEPGVYAKGIKCVSAGEPYFVGHFPGYPVMPGVLILEALAQVGAVAVLATPENKGKLAFFGGVRKCRFKRQVVPGDVLELTCEMVEQRGSVGFGNAQACVDGKIACVAELTFAIGS